MGKNSQRLLRPVEAGQSVVGDSSEVPGLPSVLAWLVASQVKGSVETGQGEGSISVTAIYQA